MTLQQATAFLPIDYINVPGITCWADLGCGSGLFTTALAQQLKQESIVYAIDKIKPAIESPANGVQIIPQQDNFITDDLRLPLLNGLLMANSLHFVQHKKEFLQRIKQSLQPTAPIVIVEYDTNRSNPWVPYPIKFEALQSLFKTIDYSRVRKLHEMPSVYNSSHLYSALILP